MLERKTADFADFQALSQENQKQQMEQQQPKSFSTLFSFFKTKMKDSEQLRNLENKLN
jgi:glucose-6-phosphate 1-dehydrogenase